MRSTCAFQYDCHTQQHATAEPPRSREPLSFVHQLPPFSSRHRLVVNPYLDSGVPLVPRPTHAAAQRPDFNADKQLVHRRNKRSFFTQTPPISWQILCCSLTVMADAQSRVHLPKHEDVVCWRPWSAQSGASILNQPYSSGHLAGSPQCLASWTLFWSPRAQNAEKSRTKTLPWRHRRRVSSGRRLCSPRWLSHGFLIHRLTFMGSRLHSLIAMSVVLCWAACLLSL